MPNRNEAKEALDAVIRKSRVHLYKPIQIAEILYRDRTRQDINLLNLEDYRTKSKNGVTMYVGFCSDGYAQAVQSSKMIFSTILLSHQYLLMSLEKKTEEPMVLSKRIFTGVLQINTVSCLTH